MIFTDLDGTLLDHETYEWKAAVPALTRCRETHVPVIPLSSKTRAEMEILRRRLGLSGPFASENGGGVFLPKGLFPQPPQGTVDAKALPPFKNHPIRPDGLDTSNWWEIPLGVPYAYLVEVLREMREAMGYPVKGFSDMGIEEISQRTGLPEEDAYLAQLREYDEPFIVPDDGSGALSSLVKSAEEKGLKVTQGGRFYHLQGKNDKGEAVKRILALYRGRYGNIRSVALGDSHNDFSMLQEADFPVLVRSEQEFPSLMDKIPGLTITPASGPAGWNWAVSRLLRQNEEVIT
ncbi:MAG: HAD-IIB family hydrolase [Desulfobacteraceae bacterium]